MRRVIKRQSFDVVAAIAAAWDFLWKDNLRQRRKDEKEQHVYRASTTYYLTASDVEYQVRKFAEDQAEGKEWGTSGRAYGKGYGSMLRISGGDLNGRVRDWLLDQVRRGRLSSHNFGRGHISGMRFRPYGEPLAPAEERTITAKKAREGKPRPCHFSARGESRLLCQPVRRSSWRHGRSEAWRTWDEAKVTCPRCLKLLAEKKQTAA